MNAQAEAVKKATLETIDHLFRCARIMQEEFGESLTERVLKETKQTLKRLEKQKAALEACESEEDIIECFSSVLEAGDMRARCMALAEITTGEPKNDIQKALFGK